jgi:hypothetical protein
MPPSVERNLVAILSGDAVRCPGSTRPEGVGAGK